MGATAVTPAVTPWRTARQISRTLYRGLLYLVLIAGAVIFIAPLVWMVATTLKPESEIFLLPPSLLGSRIEWNNFPDALSTFPFLSGFRATMILVVGVMLGQLLSTTAAAYAFARLDFPLRGPLFLVVLGTMMLPYYVVLIPQYLMFRDLGWLNSFLPLIVPSFFATSAFFVFMLRQFFMQIPREYDDAAEIDGCSPVDTFRRIILPMSTPALGAVAIFSFLGTWNDYFAPLIYLNTQENYPLAVQFKIWQMVSAEARRQMSGRVQQPYNHILAIATLVTVIPMVVFFFAQRYFIQGVVISGMKG